MSWVRMACGAVNRSLSPDSAALAALTRLDVSNNELRTLPTQLFTLLSIRYCPLCLTRGGRSLSPDSFSCCSPSGTMIDASNYKSSILKWQITVFRIVVLIIFDISKYTIQNHTLLNCRNLNHGDCILRILMYPRT